jgi:hypothetical protein
MAAELAGVELSDGSDIEDEEDYIQLRTKFWWGWSIKLLNIEQFRST